MFLQKWTVVQIFRNVLVALYYPVKKGSNFKWNEGKHVTQEWSLPWTGKTKTSVCKQQSAGISLLLLSCVCVCACVSVIGVLP